MIDAIESLTAANRHDASLLAQPSAAIEGARIVVVDDNPSMRYIIRHTLQRSKAVVLEAEDGGQALDLIHAHDVDLILMDIDMPVLDGLQACRMLRSIEPSKRIPIVFLTSCSDDAQHMEALAAGGDDFISKPFTVPILLARIGSVILRKRADREVERLYHLLQKYVSLPLRGQRRSREVERLEATVLFSDLRGFTATTATVEPACMFRAVSDTLAAQTNAVHAHGGYVDKFSGDGLLAVFEGPQATVQACEAAIAIVRWARTFDGISFWQPPPIGIGVHHGEFLRGDIGGDDLRDWTIIGTAVNVSARICGVAGALEVVASERVRERVGAQFAWGPVRHVNLKGLAGEARLHPLVIEP